MLLKRIAVAALLPIACSSWLTLSAQADEDFMQRGIELYNRGRYSEAMGALGAAQPKNVENPIYHYYMANTMVRLNLKQDAIREYKVARDLGQGGKISQYCEAALKTLEGAPLNAAVDLSKGAATADGKNAKTNWKEPLLVAFMDNDKPSIKCDEVLAKLFPSFGEQISFKRAYLNTSDPKLREMIDTYKVGACPTVLLFDDQGKIYKRYMVFVSPDQLAQDIAVIAVDRNLQHFGNSHDERVSRFRSEQLADVYRRISEEERNLTSKIQAIDEDIQNKKDQLSQYQTASRRIIDSYDRADLQQSIVTQEKNKQALKDNFEKQKNEWFALAEQRIEAMESTR